MLEYWHHIYRLARLHYNKLSLTWVICSACHLISNDHSASKMLLWVCIEKHEGRVIQVDKLVIKRIAKGYGVLNTKVGNCWSKQKVLRWIPLMSVTVVPIKSPINREQRLLLPTYISLVYLSSVPVPAILITNNFSLEYINCHSSTMLFIVSLMMIAAWGSVCFKTKYFESVNYCG